MYQVEIIGQKPVSESEGIKETDTSKTRMNHTMIRIKDPKVSLAYYQETMGMKLLRTSESKEAGFNLYFLGYGAEAPSDSPNGVNPVADREGLLELTWNYGTEKEEGQVYHNGNDEPQGKEDNQSPYFVVTANVRESSGFGHICLAVDDLQEACKRFEEKNVNWKKRLTDGRMKNIAFILDPDNYWIGRTPAHSVACHLANDCTEIVQNEAIKRSSNW